MNPPSSSRSLTGVIEQMEQFSSRLEELSSRVESAHEQSAHGLERGARHREEQLRGTPGPTLWTSRSKNKLGSLIPMLLLSFGGPSEPAAESHGRGAELLKGDHFEDGCSDK